jgi:16S rRNA (cytidine1402-2'-O)-methyltransferase
MTGAGGDAPAGVCATGAGGDCVVGTCTHEDNASEAHAASDAVWRRARELAALTMKSNNGRLPEGLVEASGVAAQAFPIGALYVVATPIGNMADMTVRAWWVLSHVDAIAAEDTRTTRALLERYGIAARLVAAHEHNERAAAQRIVERLRAGERIALVTDAGTPAISDPGARIVRAVLDAGLRVVPIPGASSLTAAASAAGVDADEVRFVGFLPAGANRRAERLRAIAASTAACVLFEAPHRFADTARELAAALEPDRRVVVARELTKKFETVAALAARDLPAWAERQPARGEYAIVIDPRRIGPQDSPDAAIDETTRRWLAALAEELPAARAAAVAARATGLPRELLYRELTALRGS